MLAEREKRSPPSSLSRSIPNRFCWFMASAMAAASCPSSRLEGSRSLRAVNKPPMAPPMSLSLILTLFEPRVSCRIESRESGSPAATLNWATPPSSTREWPVLMLTSMLPLGWVTVRISIFSESWRTASSR
ncbi:hypothetical protein D3C79_729940 [compost metagenome]